MKTFRMMALYAATLIVEYAVGEDADPGPALPGGVATVSVRSSHVEDLLMALSEQDNYDSTVTTPVCVTKVTKVQLQVVSGINYIFDVNGCATNFSSPLGNCPNATCSTPHHYEIHVFTQPWTDSYRVSNITQL